MDAFFPDRLLARVKRSVSGTALYAEWTPFFPTACWSA